MRTVDPRPRRQLERELGLDPFGVDRLVFGHPLWDQVQVGSATSDEFWAAIAAEPGVGAEGLADFRQRFWSGDRLDNDLVALLRALKEDGYLLGLLSNNPASLRKRAEELMPGLFHSMVISGSDGVMKPEPVIYSLAVERLGVKAGEAVFVDDAERNVIGARNAGLQALLFHGLAPLRRDLQDLAICVPDPPIAPVPGIRAVMFDWGGVLETLPVDADLKPWLERLGMGASDLRSALWGSDYRRMSAGWISSDEYVRRVAQAVGYANLAAATEFLRAIHAHNRLDREVLDTVRELRRAHKVALLTNAYPGHDEQVRAAHGLDVREEFDVYLNSAEVGLRKPDPAFFELALQELRCDPEEAVLLDDGLRNVDAAAAIGVHTIQHVDAPTSLRQLAGMLGVSLPK
jgi:putative hydrolase of the HAD superfamily